ncbi:hypothetical protein PsorP6_009590 [Peronosclerospora sorghi]|uniref:Uncharacterized protein n=1 Tax=Peronosclerospora sorghi TaxID=230839 RepID=A0ACC0W2L6_9STRA|nr:hypothetical protein PsorP6_009590 [Peronosclerospora sorghi]
MPAALITAEFGDEKDLYEIFGVKRSASNKEITRAYRTLALKYHPDKQRGDEASRAKATATFQAISAIHAILNDEKARAAYDESGVIQSDDLDEKSPSFQMWTQYFARIFPKISEEDINKFEGEYRYSNEERGDVLAAYTKYEGEMRHIMGTIMLSTDDDEERFANLIQEAIQAKRVKAFPKWREYVKKLAKKQKRKEKPAERKRKQSKYDNEAREAEELIKKIRGNQQEREVESGMTALSSKSSKRSFDSLVGALEAKYAEKGKKSKKVASRKQDEPSEEEFVATQQRLKRKRQK